MKHGLALTLVVFAASLSACGSKDLSKDQARGLLSDYFDKNPVTQPLLTGMDSIGIAPEADYFNSPGGKYQKALEADGLVTIASKGKVYNLAAAGPKREYFNALDIALTDKGRKFVSGKPSVVPPTASNTWPIVYENVTFCGKEVVEISNVAVNDDFARADYTWRAAKLSPFAIHFHEADPSEQATCNAAKVLNASATFERRDDAWQIATAQ